MAETDGPLHRYRFGEFVIDERRGALQLGGVDVPLRPKSWGVLRHLVRHPGELVTKQALLGAVWRGRVVTEGVLAKSVREIRLALGDDAHEIIRTVPRRSYLFEGPVAVEAIEDGKQDGEDASQEHSDAAAAAAVAGSEPTGAAADSRVFQLANQVRRPIAR